MTENIYKGVLYPFSDAVVRFAQEAGAHNIVAKTSSSAVLTRAPNVRASEVDWSEKDFHG